MRHFDELSVRARNCLAYGANVRDMEGLSAYWSDNSGNLDELSKHRNAGAVTITEIRAFCKDAFGAPSTWERRRFDILNTAVNALITAAPEMDADTIATKALNITDSVIQGIGK